MQRARGWTLQNAPHGSAGFLTAATKVLPSDGFGIARARGIRRASPRAPVNICHFTNTFLPHVGGVARAVQTLLEDQRRTRNRVLVVAPEFAEGAAARAIERSVVRIPAFTHFNDSDFSVRYPFAAALVERLRDFPAEILHAHHPFLLGDTALREAASRRVPVVFTHHTLYEHYTHYLPINNEAAEEFAADVATRFANRCQAVVAPSESVRDLITGRGVTVPVRVIPTGIDTAVLAKGDAARARKRHGIAADAPVIGHLGRLAAEKNLSYLAQAIGRALAQEKGRRALIVGEGPQREEMEKIFAGSGVSERVTMTGKLTGQALRDACAAMDVFAFASVSETQGLVLAEVMAARTPVVALDAPGVREVVRDGENGRLLPADAPAENFADALARACADGKNPAWRDAAWQTALTFDRARTNARLLALYEETVEAHAVTTRDDSVLKPALERIAVEGRIVADKAGALIRAMGGASPAEAAVQPGAETSAP